jgi:hypothetical protein
VISSGLTFIQNFAKVGFFVQNLNGAGPKAYTSHGDLINVLLSPLKEGKYTQIITNIYYRPFLLHITEQGFVKQTGLECMAKGILPSVGLYTFRIISHQQISSMIWEVYPRNCWYHSLV